jgi:menaquinone-dependent protoporphyrinogen IX oxidase
VKKLVGKTLIAYSTKSGATEKTAQKIAETLQTNGFQVDLVNLSKESSANLEAYSNVIVGSGVQKGEIYPETKAFLDRDFSGKKLAYYTCSGFIYPKTHDETLARYATAELAGHPNFKPIAIEAFGGYLKILGLKVSRNMDLSKVEAWAQDLCKRFAV